MKVRFIGKRLRINSFGTFEPGKAYDTKEIVGKQLLLVPLLFERVGKPKQEKQEKQKKEEKKEKE